ncbi:MAG: lysophospholipid acyltransferase family protein [Candidatus Omnitrophota bacterium]|nr:lysophospholipid acyltransferase family protein [Candidatus Omnitrophota bacterium]
MAFFLRLYRFTALVLFTLFVIIWSMPYHFGGWRGRREISGLLRVWAKGIAKIIGLRIRISGDIQDVPAGLVVSNHLGYIDIITHGTVFPLRYTSTTEIAKWPVIGQMIALTHPVWVDRISRSASRKALRDFSKTMKRGMYLIVYPEGTSTDGNNGILPFKSTSFEAATFGNLPVIPVLTRYNEVPGRPTVCWYGDMTLLPHIWQVLGYPVVDAEMHVLPPVYPEGRSRKEMAEHVHEIMDREYGRIVSAAA